MNEKNRLRACFCGRVHRSGSRAKALGWLFGLVLMSLGAQARADEVRAEDRATARQFALEGHQALQAGDFVLAADRFERADALVHAPTLVVDLARAYLGMGRLVEAHEAFQRVLREGVAKEAPTSWHRAFAAARREDALVEARLSWLTVRVEAPTTARVAIDGRPLPEASVGAKRAIDPGQHTILVEAEGYLPTSQTLEMREAETRELTVLLHRAPEPPKSAGAPRRTLVPPRIASEPEPSRAAAYTALGVGGAGLVLGGISTALMFVARSNLENQCEGQVCPTTSADERSRYRLFGTLAPIGAGVGLAGVGLGIYFLSSSGAARPPRSYALSPELSPRYVGVRGSF